jgi:hypothetical protein
MIAARNSPAAIKNNVKGIGMAKQTDLNNKLKTLRDAYSAQLPENIKQIRQAWSHLPLGEWDDAGFQILYLMVHNLTVTGKTFGFYLLSDVARELERSLKPLAQDKLAPSEDQRQYIQGLMNELDQLPAVRRPPAVAKSGGIPVVSTASLLTERPAAKH